MSRRNNETLYTVLEWFRGLAFDDLLKARAKTS